MKFPITFPIAIVEHGALNLLSSPIPLVGADGLQHPAEIWSAWTADDWQRHRPHWQFLDVVDQPPVITAAQTSERQSIDEWVINADAGTVTVAYRVIDQSAAELATALATAKAAAIARVNSEAGGARARFITSVIGQEGTYLDKATEAGAFAADPAPNASAYPYLFAEAEATETPVEHVAELVRQTAQSWRQINAQIEGLRKGAGKRITEAEDVATVAAVFPILWPTPV